MNYLEVYAKKLVDKTIVKNVNNNFVDNVRVIYVPSVKNPILFLTIHVYVILL